MMTYSWDKVSNSCNTNKCTIL